MHVIELTRQLLAVPSPTGIEGQAAAFVAGWLEKEGFSITRQEVEPGRFNILASAGGPVEIVLCSHLDTVPHPADSGEDARYLRGRGACDAKGPTAAMMIAGRDARREGFLRFGLLFVAGEETDSLGARRASDLNVKSRAIVIGEPTENKLALGHKGVLLIRLKAAGRAAHSAFPLLGKSAIHLLLDALQSVRELDLGEDPELGKSTLNIGRIEGGATDNMIAPEAWATVMVRCAVPFQPLLDRILRSVGERASCLVELANDPVRLGRLPGFETTVLPFGSDAPYLAGFGERFMLGPGRPEDAHTEGEKIEKSALEEAVLIYRRLILEIPGRIEGG
ncbi:MAG: M20/M25/M40 family metallo-hydrolase [Candidatus Aminicenantes bacterium]|nr:M20/M25/M40 family metallo-hydrolase [Candidatus Aminicenantes bacterium]